MVYTIMAMKSTVTVEVDFLIAVAMERWTKVRSAMMRRCLYPQSCLVWVVVAAGISMKIDAINMFCNGDYDGGGWSLIYSNASNRGNPGESQLCSSRL